MDQSGCLPSSGSQVRILPGTPNPFSARSPLWRYSDGLALPRDRERTSARAFHDAVGVEDWRVLFSGATRTSPSARSRKQQVCGRDRRCRGGRGPLPRCGRATQGVTVRTASGSTAPLSHRDVELARQISAEARKLGIEPDPSQVQVVGIAVTGCKQRRRSVLGRSPGYRSLGPKETSSIGTDVTRTCRSRASARPSRAGPDPYRRQRPGRSGRSTSPAALEAGGRLADGTHAPHWWTLASPENHGVDIAAWPDFEDESAGRLSQGDTRQSGSDQQ